MVETIFLWLAAAMCTLPFFIGVHNLLRTIKLRRNGVRVPGVIFSARRKNGASRVVFRFQAEDGRVVDAVPRITRRGEKFHEGQPITVAYDRDDPENAVIMDSRTQITGSVAFIVGSLIMVPVFTFTALIT